jgi:hypothetical protein
VIVVVEVVVAVVSTTATVAEAAAVVVLVVVVVVVVANVMAPMTAVVVSDGDGSMWLCTRERASVRVIEKRT